MPSEDLGRSYTGQGGTLLLDDTSGERLDYVLHNIPSERQMCLQHMRVIRDWGDSAGTQASDHLPVWAEYNWRGPLCNPLEAAAVVTPDFNQTGQISYPRSVQWYRIGDKGTYSIHTSSHVQFEVYAADDMSYPISDNNSVTDWGIEYKLPKPPYYVKVFANGKLWTGQYDISVHQHQCGLGDPCALTPGDTDGYELNWSGGQVNSASRWFSFQTDVGDTGLFPELTVKHDGVCNSELDVRLWDEDALSEIAWKAYQPGNVATQGKAFPPNLKKGRYLVELYKTDNNPNGLCLTWMEFDTTLTWFDPKTLVCHDETGGSGGPAEEIGHDDIWYRLQVDTDCNGSHDHNLYSYLYDFDEDDSRTKGLGIWGQRRFVGCVAVSLLEEDDISEGDVTFLGPEASIKTLELDQMGVAKREQRWNQGDYLYQMKYTLSHEEPKTP